MRKRLLFIKIIISKSYLLSTLPAGRKDVGYCWVYAVKFDARMSDWL